jgi:hypothetical protein
MGVVQFAGLLANVRSWPKTDITESEGAAGHDDRPGSAKVRSVPQQPLDPHGPRRRFGAKFGRLGSE